MTLGELTVASFQYPAIKVYITLLVIASFLTFHLESPEIGLDLMIGEPRSVALSLMDVLSQTSM